MARVGPQRYRRKVFLVPMSQKILYLVIKIYFNDFFKQSLVVPKTIRKTNSVWSKRSVLSFNSAYHNTNGLG